MIIRISSTFLILFFTTILFGQGQADYSSGAIIQRLEKLNTLGSVLYMAAHPDDENTQLIAYFANGAHFRTGYVAATRGDGGQNLIGPEIRESLGVIRTQELLAARSVDGGEQFFSRANDFGYSKDPDETFRVWDRDKVLADFVWAIRQFRPDVIITRFSREPGVTHGHHTASAILAMEAFEKSGDSTVYPEQLQYVSPWAPAKIFYNIGLWAYRRSGRVFNDEGYLKLDVGQYNPHLGKSYTEISALSRSMHKSQGFGSSGSRGADFEYFEQWGGAETDQALFEGINTSWSRVADSEEVAYYLAEARRNFDPAQPANILGELLNARKALLKMPDQFWKEVKLAELRETILAITGTYMELTSEKPFYVPGDSIRINLEVINRSHAGLTLSSVTLDQNDERFIYNLALEKNQKNQFSYQFPLSKTTPYTHPYWLNTDATEGMYSVSDQRLIGLPQNPPALKARVSLSSEGQFLDYEVPVIFKTTDPVKGEVRSPLEIRPPVMVNLDSRALIFAGNKSKKMPVKVIAGRDDISGRVTLNLPEGWKSTPDFYEVAIQEAGGEQSFDFSLTPPEGPSNAQIFAVVELSDGKKYDLGKEVIAYDHIPVQTLYPKAQVKVVKLDVGELTGRIGYIMGAGDELPFSLEQIGYQVDILDKDDVSAGNLARYDAVILGIRAFNTVQWLSFKNQELFDYVKKGGNVIVQYNTSHQLVTEEIAPFPLRLSRDRVTVEEAPVKFLRPKHPVLNTPIKLSPSDFDGWVQERGLYFPGEWSKEFVPLLGMNDPGEEEKQGSLLVAPYGKGFYCYTGISFFRELPAGVPGAYRLLINMVSLGKADKPK